MFYRTIRFICWILGHIIYRFEVTGRENVPKEGAFLLCSNHIHAFDPIVVGIFIKREPKFMAKKELFRKRFFGWFLRNFGAFPIDREATADLTAYRTTMDTLKSGNGLIIFSQGTRMKEFENAKSGVAVFALKTGAPIIPTGIRATYKPFSKIHIHYGEPISMDEYADERVRTELVEKIMATVTERVSALMAK